MLDTWEVKREHFQFLLFKILYQTPSTNYTERRLGILEEFDKFVKLYERDQPITRRRFKLIAVVEKVGFIQASSKSKWMIHIKKTDLPHLKRWLSEERGLPYETTGEN